MKPLFSLFLFLFLGNYLFAQEISLIPEPKEIKISEGYFKLSPSTRIQSKNAETDITADLFNHFLEENWDIRLKKGTARKNRINLVLDNKMPKESYTLDVSPSGITITGDAAGVFYGIQTLNQLLTEKDGTLSVPCVTISDSPRFGYRGLMLDVGRYFYSKEYIKKFIDRMAQFKLNVFHWHLTEDGGWRIEIKKYPELTKRTAWRSSTQSGYGWEVQNHIPHGGYYTQKDVKEIIQYAAERHVTIIPEIEMPGHTLGVLSVFPELSCTGGPFPVPNTWGIREDIFCAGNEKTFEFLENVLSEIIELFPSEYIHIGGDEAPKKRWEECPKCRQRIKDEGLKDTHELQSYFIQRVEKFINSKGKRIIGWDEILEGGLAPNATVMSWRGEAGGIAAANMGHDVIMAPNDYMYLDYFQSDDKMNEPLGATWAPPVTLERNYSYEPYSKKISKEQQQFIKGVQANVWGEFIHQENHVDYMAYPRALALSEIGWSPISKKDYDSFLKRLPARLKQLDKQWVTFRIPEPQGWDNITVANNKATLNLKPLVEDAVLHYTIDGSDPTVYGKELNGPVTLSIEGDSIELKCAVLLPSGRYSAVYTRVISRD